MADAIAQAADSVITIGGIQSNHCRATAVAAKYLNLDPFLILRTSKVNTDHPPTLSSLSLSLSQTPFSVDSPLSLCFSRSASCWPRSRTRRQSPGWAFGWSSRPTYLQRRICTDWKCRGSPFTLLSDCFLLLYYFFRFIHWFPFCEAMSLSFTGIICFLNHLSWYFLVGLDILLNNIYILLC